MSRLCGGPRDRGTGAAGGGGGPVGGTFPCPCHAQVILSFPEVISVAWYGDVTDRCRGGGYISVCISHSR